MNFAEKMIGLDTCITALACAKSCSDNDCASSINPHCLLTLFVGTHDGMVCRLGLNRWWSKLSDTTYSSTAAEKDSTACLKLDLLEKCFVIGVMVTLILQILQWSMHFALCWCLGLRPTVIITLLLLAIHAALGMLILQDKMNVQYTLLLKTRGYVQ